MIEPFNINILTPDNQYNLYNEIIDPTNNVKKLLDDEKNRLESKKIKINKEYDTKIRNDEFLRSSTSRRKAYYHMLMIVILMIIVCYVLYKIQIHFPIIPGILIDLLIISIVAGGIIYLLWRIVDIQKRDRLDFDKIDFSFLLKEKDVKKSSDADLLSNTIFDFSMNHAYCVGPACCPAGTNFIDNKCVEGFTPMPSYSSTVKDPR
jgi:hypothetical protein